MGFFSSLKRKKILSTDKKEAFTALGAELIQRRISISVGFCADGRNVNPLRVFTYQELCKAANGFIKHFYDDDYSRYYAGIIDECDGGRPVTIKKFTGRDTSEWLIQYIIQEIAVLSCIRHGNVAQLLGYCAEPPYCLLVFECLSNGTIQNPGAHEILWHDRLRIAIQVAEAISYIHSHGFKPIIHRDVKPSNVWLDENFNAKLSGFETSVAMPLDRTEIEDEGFTGTQGYLDPTYMRTVTLTERSDVFSFGMLLLWVVNGRDEVSRMFAERKERKLKESIPTFEEMIKQLISSSVSTTDKIASQKIALGDVIFDCIRKVRDERPSMIQVTKKLYAIRDMEPQ